MAKDFGSRFSKTGSRTKYPDPIGSFPGNAPTAHNQFGNKDPNPKHNKDPIRW